VLRTGCDYRVSRLEEPLKAQRALMRAEALLWPDVMPDVSICPRSFLPRFAMVALEPKDSRAQNESNYLSGLSLFVNHTIT
jgi:hypothetical protein